MAVKGRGRQSIPFTRRAPERPVDAPDDESDTEHPKRIETPQRAPQRFYGQEFASARLDALREAMRKVAKRLGGDAGVYFDWAEQLAADDLARRKPETVEVVGTDYTIYATKNRELEALEQAIERIRDDYPGSGRYFDHVSEITELILSGRKEQNA